MCCCLSSVEACECSFKKYDYVSGHGLSVHPGWTVLLGRRAAGVQNGRIHLRSERWRHELMDSARCQSTA